MQYFITATGTNIGKTLVTAAIAYGMQQSGEGSVTAIKPVISGYKFGEESDLSLLCIAQNLPESQQSHEEISLYRFEEALSPDMAARNLNTQIDFNEIKNFIAGFSADNLLIEGAGGVMSPLTERHTNLDLITSLNADVILVCGSYLGSISHTLTAYLALKNAGAKIAKIIVSENLQPSEHLYVSAEETLKTLSNFISENIMILKNVEGNSQQKIKAAAKNLKGLYGY